MRIAVIGTGYVGLVAGACLAETGHDVIGADIDETRIEDLKRNVLPIYEPGLNDLVERNQRSGRLQFTANIGEAARRAAIVFIAVGTPSDDDGAADLRNVLDVAEVIGRNIVRETVIVNKSTVPVGTAGRIREAIARHTHSPIHMVSNPEFLREGSAINDFLRPDRIILGIESEYARKVMLELYAPFARAGRKILTMDISSAEMTKYAANAMLATRITFMNELALLCETTGADIDQVRQGVGADTRIGSDYLSPGAGYGGSCLPKDVRALIRTACEASVPLEIISAVDRVNERQKRSLVGKVCSALNAVNGPIGLDQPWAPRVAVWGLAFKPQTDDLRESPSLVIIEELLAYGTTVCVHDPVALAKAERRFGGRIEYAKSSYDAIRGSDALVIVTDWHEYRHPNFARMQMLMRHPIVVDGRNMYDAKIMEDLGFIYYAVGRRPCNIVLS